MFMVYYQNCKTSVVARVPRATNIKKGLQPESWPATKQHKGRISPLGFLHMRIFHSMRPYTQTFHYETHTFSTFISHSIELYQP